MAYLDTLHDLATDTEDKVWTVVQSWQNHEIDRAEASALIAAIIAVANRRATALGDLSVAATITVGTRSPVPAVGVSAPDDVARLNRAAGTLLDALEDTPDPEARARRLGRSEPLQKASDARSEAISRSPQVEGWTRNLNGDTCQLCTWWHRDGRVWPKTHTMPRHKGCDCTQSPILVDRVKPVSR
ncbi:hypothetical protein FNH13_08335 [Ornithinimicrobium ciconiae]|uniref:Phage head morphogenesis domain-containing protein n=1 Tax=Ornithinimicrobium ciconiae TaxID=2594265 RepID=A0A516G9Z3_9MICO|nr:hypothetical protein [Ornithinimicrobium ciconiae]QDO88349.1 hypothetical protein FNH13_08335 [Ornithinimicrobium ciconiae]